MISHWFSYDFINLTLENLWNASKHRSWFEMITNMKFLQHGTLDFFDRLPVALELRWYQPSLTNLLPPKSIRRNGDMNSKMVPSDPCLHPNLFIFNTNLQTSISTNVCNQIRFRKHQIAWSQLSLQCKTTAKQSKFQFLFIYMKSWNLK